MRDILKQPESGTGAHTYKLSTWEMRQKYQTFKASKSYPPSDDDDGDDDDDGGDDDGDDDDDDGGGDDDDDDRTGEMSWQSRALFALVEDLG